MDGACAAGSNAAAEFGTGKIEMVAQYPQERGVGGGVDFRDPAVDVECLHGIPVDGQARETKVSDIFYREVKPRRSAATARVSAQIAYPAGEG